MQVNETFEQDLSRLMDLRGIVSKSEAIRVAVHESLENELAKCKKSNFKAWLGAALAPGLNPNPRFNSDDDLWEKG